MRNERRSTAEALRERLELERLFGIREVYVGKRKRAKRAKVGEAGRPAGEPGAPPRDGKPPAGESGARTRRREAVEAARRRSSEAARAREVTKGPDGAPAQEAEPEREIVIESLGGSHDEMSLLSEAERSGIPHVSAKEAPNAERLAELAEAAGGCSRCGLAGGRTNVVFGEGDPEAKLVFVGEAPGAEEDRTGRPFVGRAGKLLTKIIEAMGYAREDVYICNVLKSRPPGNRNPLPDEIAACSPFLHEQLAVIRPKAICALGGPASQTLLKTKEGITRLRGRFFWYRGIPLMPTFHPAYLLRNPKMKKEVWEDMKTLKRFLERPE
ncbi:MAG: uracil-DNA glycosylase [Planctomycetota bacterium]